MFSSTVEQEKLVEMKKGKDCKTEEKWGGKGTNESSELKTNQKEHPSLSPASSPISPVSSPLSPVTSPVRSVSSTGNQMQATLPSSPPTKKSECLQYGTSEKVSVKLLFWVGWTCKNTGTRQR